MEQIRNYTYSRLVGRKLYLSFTFSLMGGLTLIATAGALFTDANPELIIKDVVQSAVTKSGEETERPIAPAVLGVKP